LPATLMVCCNSSLGDRDFGWEIFFSGLGFGAWFWASGAGGVAGLVRSCAEIKAALTGLSNITDTIVETVQRLDNAMIRF
jgi:hypothetical protein